MRLRFFLWSVGIVLLVGRIIFDVPPPVVDEPVAATNSPLGNVPRGSSIFDFESNCLRLENRKPSCIATTNESRRNIFDHSFFNKPGFGFTDEEVLQKEAGFKNEYSRSLLDGSDDSVRHIESQLLQSHCAQRDNQRDVYVLSTCRDNPKRALEFIAHYLLLGAKKVIIIDFSAASEDLKGIQFQGFAAVNRVEVVDAACNPTFGRGEIPDSLQWNKYKGRYLRSAIERLNSSTAADILVVSEVNDFVVFTHNENISHVHKCLFDLPQDRLLAIPKAIVLENRHTADYARSGLEFVQFATGNSQAMVNRYKASKWSFRDVALFGTASALAGLVFDDEAPGAFFADGTTPERLQTNNGFIDEAKVKYFARVVHVGNSVHRHVMEKVDRCYLNENSSSVTDNRFNLAELFDERQPDNKIDDLPSEHSLAVPEGAFTSFYREYLRLMKFSFEHSDKQHLVSDGFVSPKLKLLILDHLKTPNGEPVTEDMVTNKNVATGKILLREENLLKPLRKDNIEAKLGGPGATSQSSCFHFHENGTYTAEKELLNISICMIAKGRAKVTVENILFHRLQGVSHFIIADDGSPGDTLRRALQPLVELGLVTVISAHNGVFPNRYFGQIVQGPQMAVYARCAQLETERALNERHEKSPWIGFLDSDEFALIRSHDGCIPRLIKSLAAQVEANPEEILSIVGFQWRMIWPLQSNIFDNYTTQFHRNKFALDARSNDAHGHAKSFIRVDRMRHGVFPIPHGMSFHNHSIDKCVFPSGAPMGCIGFQSGPPEVSQRMGYLAHFQTRTLISWLEKSLHGTPDDTGLTKKFDMDDLANYYFQTAKPDMSERLAEEVQEFGSFPQLMQRVQLLGELVTG